MVRFKLAARLAVTAGLAFCVAGSFADVPRTFNYQGKLSGYGNANVGITVRLYDAPSGGNTLYTELNAATLRDGVFSITVGSVSGVPTSALGALPVWVGVSVDGGPELTPRTKLHSVPFAYKALGAERLIIPGTFDSAATVGPNGEVVIDERVQINAAADNGGVVFVRNAANTATVRLDGQNASGGGRIEVANGATTSVDTVVIDGNDASDSSIELFDGGGFQAVRMHSDLFNNGPEFSMFVGAANLPSRETVQIQAYCDASSAGAGEVRLRRVDPTTHEAVTTVELAAVSDNLQGQAADGGEFILRHADGSPVFTVHAGDGGAAISPTWMELQNANDNRRFRVTPSGLNFYDSSNQNTINLGAANGTASFSGEVTVAVLTITGGSDLSERFDICAGNGAVEPGTVVCIDPATPGGLVVSDKSYDRTIAGVISGAGGVKPGMMMSQSGTLADGKHAVALTGRVWVKCDALAGAIEPGDLLTSSATPGHAMRVEQHDRALGACLGKAMTSLAAGERGLVLVLVNLQ